MSILIGAEIEKALESGLIRIEPLDRSQVGPGSIDLTLGNDFRVFRKKSKVYHVKNDSRFEDITRSVHVEDGSYVVIKPGEMILGITLERITLADNISGRLEGRSRFAIRPCGPCYRGLHAPGHLEPSGPRDREPRTRTAGPVSENPDLPVRVREVRGPCEVSGEICRANQAVRWGSDCSCPRRPPSFRTW